MCLETFTQEDVAAEFPWQFAMESPRKSPNRKDRRRKKQRERRKRGSMGLLRELTEPSPHDDEVHLDNTKQMESPNYGASKISDVGFAKIREMLPEGAEYMLAMKGTFLEVMQAPKALTRSASVPWGLRKSRSSKPLRVCLGPWPC
eukprot:TRINITY_DN9854_c1_g1_i1.p1 TRINITY_DN9854_c1_g1~~TRINITY_DN9854_c1_g1_i1.p1  ORF type:complete len:146 (+),score=31.85 TRINITY_DN9854_c1_g1_i1:83-520(+)